MLADLQNIISDKQTLIAAVGTVVGTNVLDLRAVGTVPIANAAGNFLSPIADIGRMYHPPDLMIQITTTVLAAGGAATVDFQILNSAATNLGSPTTLDSSGAIAKATLVAGYQVPAGRAMNPTALRYIGTNYVIATNDVTAGAVWCGIASTRQTTPYVTQ
jgi:hypothetical protein